VNPFSSLAGLRRGQAALLLSAFAAVVATTAYSYRAIDAELSEMALSRRASVSYLAAAVLAEKFDRLVDIGVSLATRVRFRELVEAGQWTEAVGILGSVPADFPFIDRVALNDPRGTLMADMPATGPTGRNFAHRDWYQAVVRTGRPHISQIYRRAAPPQMNVFVAAVPIKSAKGDLLGLMVLQVRPDRFFDWTAGIEAGPGGLVYVVDRRGVLAAHPKVSSAAGLIDYSGAPAVKRILEGKKGVEIVFDQAEKEERVVAFEPIARHGWGVVLEQPAASVFATRNEQLRWVLGAYGLILVLLICFALLASRVALQHKRAEVDARAKAELLQSTRDLAREIAERKLADERNRAVVDSALDGIISMDHAGLVVGFNPAAERIFGYRNSDVIGRALAELIIPPALREQHARGLAHYLATGAGPVLGKRIEITGQRADGSAVPVELTITRLPGSGPPTFTAFLRDLTEREQAQAAIANYAERLDILHEIDRAIIAAEAPEAIAEAALRRLRDLVGVPRAIVNMIDPATGEAEWLAAVGRRRAHVGPGMRFSTQLMGDVEGLRRGEMQVIDTACLPPGPEVKALLDSGIQEYMVVPMIAGGELIGGLSFGGAKGQFPTEHAGIVREVAAQLAIAIAQARLHERVKRQAQELEQRVAERTAQLEMINKDLESFGYSVSHDLRAPLRSIEGFARIIEEDYAHALDAEGLQLFGVIRANSRKMETLIDDLLAFSKLGRQEIVATSVDMNALVGEVLEELRAAGAGLSAQITVAELPVALGDRALLKQVWTNLLSNAMKFSGARDRPVIEVTGNCGEVEDLYSVKDNGVGFDMRYSGKLFGVFQRLHGVSEFPGTGVGLAIVHRIVSRHGGRVWTLSELNHGAEFFFALPRSPVPSAEVKTAAARV